MESGAIGAVQTLYRALVKSLEAGLAEHVIGGTIVVAELGLTHAARVGAAGSVARGAVLVGCRRVTHLI